MPAQTAQFLVLAYVENVGIPVVNYDLTRQALAQAESTWIATLCPPISCSQPSHDLFHFASSLKPRGRKLQTSIAMTRLSKDIRGPAKELVSFPDTGSHVRAKTSLL